MTDQPLATNDGHVPMLAHGPIFLRPAERSDIPIFVRWLADARTSRTLSIISPLSLASEERWFEELVEHHGRDRWHFVICRIEDGRPVGAIDLREIDLRNGNAGLGITIGDPADTGQGYGSSAIRALLAFSFGELRLERVWLDVYDFNAGARRMYERVGFTHEGTLRHAMFHDGAFHDIHVLAILRDEWGRSSAD
jgi:RimJ/RimL family protein N-acetyltransferase